MKKMNNLFNLLPSYIKGNNIAAFAIDNRNNENIKFFLFFCMSICKLHKQKIDVILRLLKYPDLTITIYDLYKVYEWFISKKNGSYEIDFNWTKCLQNLLEATTIKTGGKKAIESRYEAVGTFLHSYDISKEAANALLCLLLPCGELSYANFKDALYETCFSKNIMYKEIPFIVYKKKK